jgi:hypothetical protein
MVHSLLQMQRPPMTELPGLLVCASDVEQCMSQIASTTLAIVLQSRQNMPTPNKPSTTTVLCL